VALMALAPVLALACWPACSAASSTSFPPCTEPGFSCASVAVPLDRTAAVPGTISLSVARKLAGPSPSHDAVLALAGGPGQAALPLSKFIAEAIAPALPTRDLIVFDQRGTGRSDPLNCPIFGDLRALEGVSTSAYGTFVEECAQEIGAARGGYTTEESVEDIEAIRRAYGYEKLVLYGTSYGTKVALEYAERYPQHVEALVLDSGPKRSRPRALRRSRRCSTSCARMARAPGSRPIRSRTSLVWPPSCATTNSRASPMTAPGAATRCR
jgi:pimeloyl-ACP methyl ester carboxylesterase